jgi:hypothetical protein
VAVAKQGAYPPPIKQRFHETWDPGTTIVRRYIKLNRFECQLLSRIHSSLKEPPNRPIFPSQ